MFIHAGGTPLDPVLHADMTAGIESVPRSHVTNDLVFLMGQARCARNTHPDRPVPFPAGSDVSGRQELAEMVEVVGVA